MTLALGIVGVVALINIATLLLLRPVKETSMRWPIPVPAVTPAEPAPVISPTQHAINIGRKYKRKDGVATHHASGKLMSGTVLAKPSRRVLRRAAMLGPVDASLAAVRLGKREVQRLASNSHEAKRYVEAVRRDRAAKRNGGAR